MSEVADHNHERSCWVVINGDIYDVTEFLSNHPGGTSPLLQYAGKDASIPFRSLHPVGALELIRRYQIGVLMNKENIACEQEPH